MWPRAASDRLAVVPLPFLLLLCACCGCGAWCEKKEGREESWGVRSCGCPAHCASNHDDPPAHTTHTTHTCIYTRRYNAVQGIFAPPPRTGTIWWFAGYIPLRCVGGAVSVM